MVFVRHNNFVKNRLKETSKYVEHQPDRYTTTCYRLSCPARGHNGDSGRSGACERKLGKVSGTREITKSVDNREQG